MIKRINRYTITAVLFLITIFTIAVLNFDQLKENIQKEICNSLLVAYGIN